MSPGTRILLNLAGRPARNRRLFRSIGGLLAVLIVVFVFFSGSAWLKYGVEKKALRRATEKTERMAGVALGEENRLAIQIQNAEKTLGSKVGILNSIILRKTFSWTDLFAHLEASLPDSSFITSLAPSFADDSTLVLKIQVVSRSLEDLVRLINNLSARDFKDIHIANDSRDPMGRILTEVSLSYERVR